MPTILIFRTGGLGDVILSTVALNIIRQHAPQAKIIWAGREPTISLIQSFYPDITFFDLQRDKSNLQHFKLLRGLLKEPDLVIDLQRSPRTILLGYLLKLSFKKTRYVTWNKFSFERSLFVLRAKLSGRNGSSNTHKKQLPTRVAAMALCTKRGLAKINIPVTYDIQSYSPLFIKPQNKENNIAICLGSLYPLKELALEKVNELLSFFISGPDSPTVFLLGDKDKLNDAEKLVSLYPGNKIYDYCGKTSLTEAANILSTCRFALVNDSALAHLSEAVDTPVFMFFGPTHPGLGYRPHLSNSISFSANLGCQPCHKSGNTTCRYKDELCKKQPDLSQVYLHSKKLAAIG